MQQVSLASVITPFSKAIGWCLLFAIILPIGGAVFLKLSVSAACTLVATAFLIEYGSIPIGIALGLPPLYVTVAATCIEAGIFLVLYGILDTVGTASVHVAKFLDWTHHLVKQSRIFDRYGIFGLCPVEIIIGVYLCSPATWLLGWDKWKAFAITMTGYLIAAVITTFGTVGFIHYFIR